MATELTGAIQELTKMLKQGEVKCESCGCIVPIAAVTCTQCGAPLPAVKDNKAEKKEANREKRNLYFDFSDDPHFDQYLWFVFYRNCFNIGVKLAEIFNNGTKIERSTPREEYLCRLSLLSNMVRGDVTNVESNQFYYDECSRMAADVMSMKGFNSFADVNRYNIDWAIKQDPVVMGFMYGSNGTLGSSKLGPTFYNMMVGFYYCLEPVQEIALLTSVGNDDLFCEKYVSKFIDTEIPSWCRRKQQSFFSSSKFCDWDKSPANFANNILNDKKIMKKFMNEFKQGILYFLSSSDIKDFNSSSLMVKDIDRLQTVLGVYCYHTVCKLLKLEDTVCSEDEITYSHNWITNNLSTNDIIVIPN